MQILISSPATSRYFVLKCQTSDLVSQVKTAIETKEGLQASEQFLSFQFKPLSDFKRLDEYGIKDKSTLTLNIRTRGGSVKMMSRDNSQAESTKTMKKIQQKNSKSIIEDFIRDKEKLLPKDFSSIDDVKDLYHTKKKLKQQKYEGKTLRTDESGILSIAISHDNKFVVYGLENGSVKVLEFDGKREYCNFNRTHTNAVKSIGVSGDNKYIVSASHDRSIKVFDLQKKQEYHHFKNAHQGAINSIAFSNVNTLLVSGADDGSIKIFDILTKQQVYHFDSIHTSSHLPSVVLLSFLGSVTSVGISNDNTLIVSGSSDNSIKIFDLQTKQELNHFKHATRGSVRSIAISCDSKLMIVGSSRSIQVFDVLSKQELYHFPEALESEITSIVLFGNDRYIVSSSVDGYIKIFDLQTKQELSYFKDAHSDRINSVCVSKDNRYLLSASNDSTINIFDLQTEQEQLHFKDAHSSEVTSIVISSDKRFVISGSLDRSIKIFDIHTKQEHHQFKDAHEGPISAIAISCDDRFIVSGSHDHSIKVFDIQTKQEYYHFSNIHADVVSSVAVSIHNKCIVSGSFDKSIKVLDIRTKQELHHFRDAHTDIICSVAVSSDDRFIVSGSRDNSIKIIDLKTRQIYHQFKDVHKNGVNTIALSNDSKYIISGGNDNSIKVFDFQEKQQLYQFKNAHKDTIQSVSISSDNKFIISGSWDNSIKVFDLTNRQEHCHFQNAHTNHITSVAISKDNSLIVSASNDQSLKVFRIPATRDAEIAYRSINIPPNLPFASFGDFIFTHSTYEHFTKLLLHYRDLQILPHYWTILHILCIFQKSKIIARYVSYQLLKVPSLLDRYGKTPLDYLIAQDNIHYPSVNIVLTYILDYLGDKLNSDPYEVEMIFRSLTPLFQFILSKTNSTIRDRYMKAIFISPYSYEELPSFGRPVVQKTIAKSLIVDSKVIEKIHSEGNEQIMFRTIMLYCDYSSVHDDMYNLIRTLVYLKNEEVFKFPVISHLINHLWNENKHQMMAGSFMFAVYTILFSVYIGIGERTLWMEIIILYYGCFSLVGEFIQMYVLGNRYGEFIWCWIDIILGLLTLPFIILRFTNEDETLAVKWIGSVIMVLSYIRWATYLRLFKPIRSLIQVVMSIIQDMGGFILFIAFIIICFSLILLQFERDLDFHDHLYVTYETLFAIYEDNEMSVSQKIIGGVVLFILNVVFLNLLISIMGDSYDKVQERRVLTDSLTKLDMVLEATSYSKLMSKFRPKKEDKGFLVYCLPDRGDEDEDPETTSEWEGRINVIKKMLKQNEQKVMEIIEKKMDITEKEMDKKINTLEQKIEQEISQVKQLVESNHQEMLRTIKQLLSKE